MGARVRRRRTTPRPAPGSRRRTTRRRVPGRHRRTARRHRCRRCVPPGTRTAPRPPTPDPVTGARAPRRRTAHRGAARPRPRGHRGAVLPTSRASTIHTRPGRRAQSSTRPGPSLLTRRTTRRPRPSNDPLERLAAPPTCRVVVTGSRARERHHRRHRMATGGAMARPLARPRPTGKARRPRVAGTGRRLPVAGTNPGRGHRLMRPTGRTISHRSRTTPIPSFRFSTRTTGVSVTGSSALGYRCTNGADGRAGGTNSGVPAPSFNCSESIIRKDNRSLPRPRASFQKLMERVPMGEINFAFGTPAGVTSRTGSCRIALRGGRFQRPQPIRHTPAL